MLNKLFNQVIERVSVNQQHIVVTGLSRSGKSTLFTSLMAQLFQRIYGNDAHQPMPLLKTLPLHRLVDVEFVENDDNTPRFPYQEHFNRLKQLSEHLLAKINEKGAQAATTGFLARRLGMATLSLLTINLQHNQ